MGVTTRPKQKSERLDVVHKNAQYILTNQQPIDAAHVMFDDAAGGYHDIVVRVHGPT
jgi:hypothetical protein